MPNTDRARTLRHNQTDAERKLWHYLRNRGLGGYKFRRQHPIGPYITDFCCTEQHLIVEIDGSQHTTQREKDAKRTQYLENQGYRVKRFWADEAVRETESVVETILYELKKPSPPPSPKGRGGLNKISIASTLPVGEY